VPAHFQFIVIEPLLMKTTRKSRTPKQVGSRLQQVRNTCKGDKSKNLTWEKSCNQLTISFLVLQLVSLVSHRDTPEWHPTESSSQASIMPLPKKLLPQYQYNIHVQISLQELKPCPIPVVRFIEKDPMHPYIINLSPLSHVDPEVRASASSIVFPNYPGR
jgi:TEA/ATTS domain